MSAAFVFPVNRPVDTNGLTMSGAKAFFYTTETLAPADVYTTSDLSVAHANPVVADSGGLFPNIFLDPAIAYRMILKSVLNITIADVDPVASDGGVFDPGYAGGVTRTITAKLSERVSVKDFGATGDGVTNDGAAFVAAIAYLKSIAGNPTNAIYKASGVLFIPAGHYYLGTTTLEITHTITLQGEGGTGFGNDGTNFGGAATMLRWAANTTGIRIQDYQTSGASTIDGAPHFSGRWAQIRHLMLVGGMVLGTTAEGDYHAIHAKAQVIIDDVMADSWQGDGIFSDAGVPYSNTNISRVTNFTAKACRRGRYLTSGDSNAWLFLGCDYLSNRQAGVYDTSFLGNTEIGAHADGNGFRFHSSHPTSIVGIGGSQYAVKMGQAVGASTNAPKSSVVTITIASPGVVTWASHGLAADTPVSFATTGALPTGLAVNTTYYVKSPGANDFQLAATAGGAAINTTGTQSGVHTAGAGADNTWWYYISPGPTSTNIPLWTNGISVRDGGPYFTNNNNASNVFVGCYAEGGQPPCQFTYPTRIDGGALAAGVKGTGTYTYSYQGAFRVAGKAIVDSDLNLSGILYGPTLTADGPVFGELAFRRSGVLDAHFYNLASTLYLETDTFNYRTAGGTQVAAFTSAGVDLASGKVFKVNGTQVVSSRVTGWTAATGTATRSTFATGSVTLPVLAEHVKALIDDLVAHGLIGT